ncbi:unnamed protein product [Pedinophyceae sp. YPF-701]|nr:unnamed protein product [Pedinophyceae sp. YPF-701]
MAAQESPGGSDARAQSSSPPLEGHPGDNVESLWACDDDNGYNSRLPWIRVLERHVESKVAAWEAGGPLLTDVSRSIAALQALAAELTVTVHGSSLTDDDTPWRARNGERVRVFQENTVSVCLEGPYAQGTAQTDSVCNVTLCGVVTPAAIDLISAMTPGAADRRRISRALQDANSSALHTARTPHVIQLRLLRFVARDLRRPNEAELQCMEQLRNARKPLLRARHALHGTLVEISCGSLSGFKAAVIREMIKMDDRVRPLMIAAARWAQREGAQVVDGTRKLLTPYALDLLVLFHLQTLRKPVLPPIRELFPAYQDPDGPRPLDGVVSAEDVDDRVARMLVRATELVSTWRSGNEAGVGQLLALFVERVARLTAAWADGTLGNRVPCTWHGAWVAVPDTELGRRMLAMGNNVAVVPDPIESVQNNARNLSMATIQHIAETCRDGQAAFEACAALMDQDEIQEQIDLLLP